MKILTLIDEIHGLLLDFMLGGILNRLSHSYIFLGTNKETTEKAIELAQTVNCENVHLAPCGLCSTCKRSKMGFT